MTGGTNREARVRIAQIINAPESHDLGKKREMLLDILAVAYICATTCATPDKFYAAAKRGRSA